MQKIRLAVMTLALACALFGQAIAAADAAALYGRCSACHKATGTGTPGIFPPLAGHAAKLGAASRAYLIQVILFGVAGDIRVGGKEYKGRMPAYADLLDDAEIAAVLNYILSSWGNDKALPGGFAKVTTEEVRAQRAGTMTPDQVFLARAKLKLD